MPNYKLGFSILRQFLFSQFQYLQFENLIQCGDVRIAAIAEKSLKEIAYHVRWSREWVIRLGDGTTESRNKMIAAWSVISDYVGEFFIPSEEEMMLTGSGLSGNPASLKDEWTEIVSGV